MKTSLNLDHVILLVKDLEDAKNNYQKLGFNVLIGGKLTGGADNAIIPFNDGTYLELFSVGAFVLSLSSWMNRLGLLGLMSKGRGPMEKRFIPRFARGEGICDYAVHTATLTQDLTEVRERGLSVVGPVSGTREQKEGPQIQFEWGLPDGRDLPFRISDKNSRELRVPKGASTNHPNGVTGIKSIVVVAADLDESSNRFEKWLGIGSKEETSELVTYSLGSSSIVLTGIGSDPEKKRHLARFGSSPFSVRLTTSDKSKIGILDQLLTKKARIQLVE